LRISYAQNAEDIVLARLFDRQERGFYVDVGAGHPVDDSVTKLLSDAGWTGANIEPAETLFSALSRERPNDRNYQCAIDRQEGMVELHTYPGRWGWSTIDQRVHEGHFLRGLEGRTEAVQARTLDSILSEVSPQQIDLLKVDVEGSESAVFDSFNISTYKPRVIVVEATWPGTRKATYQDWEPIIVAAGYCMTLFDGLNKFYVSIDDAAAKAALAAPANSLDEFVPYKWWRLLDPGTQKAVLGDDNEISAVQSATSPHRCGDPRPERPAGQPPPPRVATAAGRPASTPTPPDRATPPLRHRA